MSFKIPKEIEIITPTINTRVYIKMLDNFLIPSRENWFCGVEIIFQDNNTPCHSFASGKANKINHIARSPDINPAGNLW